MLTAWCQIEEVDENEEPSKAPAPDTPTAFQVGGLQQHVLKMQLKVGAGDSSCGRQISTERP